MRAELHERVIGASLLGLVFLGLVATSMTLGGVPGSSQQVLRQLADYRAQAGHDPVAVAGALTDLQAQLQADGSTDPRVMAAVYTLHARVLPDHDREWALQMALAALASDPLSPGLRDLLTGWAEDALSAGETDLALDVAIRLAAAFHADADARLILSSLLAAEGSHAAAVSYLTDIRALVSRGALRLTQVQQQRFDDLWHESHLALFMAAPRLVGQLTLGRAVDGLFTAGAADRLLIQLADWAFEGGHLHVVAATRAVRDSDHLRWLHGEMLAGMGRYRDAHDTLSGLEAPGPPDVLADRLLYRDVLAREMVVGADTMGVFRAASGDRVLTPPLFPLYYQGMVLMPVGSVWPSLPGAGIRSHAGGTELTVDGELLALIGHDGILVGNERLNMPVRRLDGVLFAPLNWLVHQAGYEVTWHPEHNLLRFFADPPDLDIGQLVADAQARGTWPAERGVAKLTFDDGPVPAWTIPILDILDDKGVLATFFVLGKQVAKYPEVLALTHDRGHSITITGTRTAFPSTPVATL